MNNKKYVAIVLSAGRGTRMKSDIPKQYLLLEDKPILAHSLLAFEESDIDYVVLVTGAADIEYVSGEIVDKYNIKKVKKIVGGGAERYNSVHNGLLSCEDADYVLIHDGARPYITKELINKNIEEVSKYPAHVTAVPVTDTIKLADTNGYVDKTLDRKLLWSIQTPQTFDYRLVKDAYNKYIEDLEAGTCTVRVTDDASVVELYTDTKVKFLMGEYTNIKITNPSDLKK